MWYDLLAIIEDVDLVEEEDHILWSFNSTGKYSVQSLYVVIITRESFPPLFILYGNLKYPLGCKFFLWLLSEQATPAEPLLEHP